MGLMDFAKKKAAEVASAVAKDVAERIDRPKEDRPKSRLEIRTDQSYLMYVYDGRPLKKVRKGSKFELTYRAKRTRLKSIYTGNVDHVPGAFFHGKTPVGCTFSEWLNGQLASHGDSVSVTCKLEGWDKGGWPNVRFYLP